MSEVGEVRATGELSRGGREADTQVLPAQDPSSIRAGSPPAPAPAEVTTGEGSGLVPLFLLLGGVALLALAVLLLVRG